jgi:hypothetical protein
LYWVVVLVRFDRMGWSALRQADQPFIGRNSGRAGTGMSHCCEAVFQELERDSCPDRRIAEPASVVVK